MEAITFPNDQITMAGNLYLPEGLDRTGRHPAVVVVHPGGGVKEQAAGLYASKLAEQGFVALTFDASYQGDSGGEPHHLEDPTPASTTSARPSTTSRRSTSSTPSASARWASASAAATASTPR